jgi:hypothetical protein
VWRLAEVRARHQSGLAESAARVGLTLEADPGCGCRCTEEDPGHDDARDGRIRPRDERACDERPDERSDAFARARGDVRGEELVRCPGKRGEERILDRPDEGSGAGNERRKGVHEHDRPAVCDEGGGREDARGSNEVDARKHPIAAEPLDERRCERRGDDPRSDANGAQQADRERSAGVVRDHEQDDEERPVGGSSRGPRHLDPADRRVARDLSQCDSRRAKRPCMHGRDDPTPSAGVKGIYATATRGGVSTTQRPPRA